jgi:hypothetical protein
MTIIRSMRDLLGRAAAAIATVIAAVLLPKCPVCIAAYLAALGLGAGAAHGAAPFVRPVVFAVASFAAVALVLGLWRVRRGRAAERCCGHHNRS